MPLYQVLIQESSLNDTQCARIAEGITDIHLDMAGGLRQFVNVVFQQYAVGRGFNAGVVAAPMVVGGSIRAGRDQAVKTAIMQAISDLVMSVTNISPKDLTVSIADVKASNAMEGGHVLPEPGEEMAWLAKVGPLLGLST